MKNLVWAVGTLIIIVVGTFLFTSQNRSENDTIIPSPIPYVSPSPNLIMEESTSSASLPFPLLSKDELKSKKVKISTEKGDILIEVSSDTPLASSNFLYLVNKKFYDGLTFHRREEGFVVQGGDPKGNGTGGPGYTFADEQFAGDYRRGTVAMANAGPNTNGSQFFIMLKDVLQLPKQYTIFGMVIDGMDVVDKVEVGDNMTKVLVEP